MPGVCLVISAMHLNGVALALLWKSQNTDRPLQTQRKKHKCMADEKARNEYGITKLSSKKFSLDVKRHYKDLGKTQTQKSPAPETARIGEFDNKAFADDLDTSESGNSQNIKRTENVNITNSGFNTSSLKRNVNHRHHTGQSIVEKHKPTVLESLKCLA